MRLLRPGVARLREEIEALVGEPVLEITAATDPGRVADARVVVGTEAALHRVEEAEVVVFLDVDQELLAPRYRAGEQALALLARAGRLVGGRDGRIVVQTRVPRHPVLDAVLHADPGRLTEAERDTRRLLGFPPFQALASVSGAGAAAVVAVVASCPGITVLGPADDRYLVRAPDHTTLCDALAAAPRPVERVRIEVDPQRV